MTDKEKFSTITGFCGKCGSILPLLQEFGSVKCYACSEKYDPDCKYRYYHFLN